MGLEIMKKILLINNGYPSSKNPQYSTYISSIYGCMKDAGLNVELLVLDTNFSSKKEKIKKYYNYYKRLFEHDYTSYCAVYIHNYPHSFLPLLFKLSSMKQLAIHWHGTDISPASLLGKILNRLSYFVIPKNTIHLAPSNYFADMVSKRLKIKRENIIISPSGGVDISAFPLSEKLENDTVTLGFASSMRTDKGIDFVLKLMQQSEALVATTGRKVKLLCIGYGAEKEYYTQMFSKIRGVEIIDPLSKDKMASFYQKIDLLLLSTRMRESLALVGLEAMSCGVPVIATNDFALKEYVIEGVSGEKFEKGDYDSFFDAVVMAISNLDHYHPREIVIKQYSQEYITHQYIEIFGNLDE